MGRASRVFHSKWFGPALLLRMTVMNPHAIHSLSPGVALRQLVRHRVLLGQLVWRDVASRYRGSFFGLFWSVLHPLLMLAVYTFVFSVVFQARWEIGEGQPRTVFAVVLFVGLMVHALLGEVLNRAPTMMLAHVNYVKKVVFPLSILPVVVLGSALINLLISMGVLIVAMALLGMHFHPTFIAFPLVVMPMLPMLLGLAWGLSALGVYVRDIGQLTGIITTVLLFLSPIFFPIDALPAAYRPLIELNPLTLIIEESRKVLLWGQWPDWLALGRYALGASVVGWLGFAAFQSLRKGFSDVL